MRHETIHHWNKYPAERVQMGEVSQRVYSIQDFLGVPRGPWGWGAVTRLAEFQSSVGLVASGIADVKTLSAIALADKR